MNIYQTGPLSEEKKTPTPDPVCILVKRDDLDAFVREANREIARLTELTQTSDSTYTRAWAEQQLITHQHYLERLMKLYPDTKNKRLEDACIWISSLQNAGPTGKAWAKAATRELVRSNWQYEARWLTRAFDWDATPEKSAGWNAVHRWLTGEDALPAYPADIDPETGVKRS